MLQYSYNKIIIVVTNFIILKFFSAQFVHPGTLELDVLFYLDIIFSWKTLSVLKTAL